MIEEEYQRELMEKEGSSRGRAHDTRRNLRHRSNSLDNNPGLLLLSFSCGCGGEKGLGRVARWDTGEGEK